MNLFKLYCTVYDSHHYWLYTHSDPFRTKYQFEADMKFLLVKYGREYLEEEKECWAGSGGWIKFISGKFSELGYEQIEPISTGFTSGMILDDSDAEFGQIIGKELWKSATAHNDRIRKEMDAATDEFARINKLNAEN